LRIVGRASCHVVVAAAAVVVCSVSVIFSGCPNQEIGLPFLF
jgi:hypothetical protein